MQSTLSQLMDSVPGTADLAEILARQRRGFLRDGSPSAGHRRELLTGLAEALREHREALAEAISADFGNRSRYETLFLEIFPCLEGIKHARGHLRRWMRPRRRPVSIWFQPGRAKVIYQPLGVVGVIVPWNYPIFLAIGPLTAALAAGNRVMIKMPELAEQTGRVFKSIMAEVFNEEEVAVILGGPDIAETFSQLPFDHLLFTGSTAVGRKVMAAASQNLTPVTLELGGKSPVIIGPDANLELAAQRILAGKLFNAGQTCVAPDYVLLPERAETAFATLARKAVARLYPDLASTDYTSIVSDRHLQRLEGYLTDARERGAEVLDLSPAAGPAARATRKMGPHLVMRPSDQMKVMDEEIFGPILPVKTYASLDEAIDYVNARPRPLALYYFGKSGRNIQRVLDRTISGGVTINDTVYHVAQESLPFGGVGQSGMGHYHGEDGFHTFSKKKGVFSQSRLNGVPLLLPPFGKLAEWMSKIMMR